MINKFIKEARKKYPTDKALAESIGMEPQNFQKYKNGERSPTVSTLKKWCKLSGVEWTNKFKVK